MAESGAKVLNAQAVEFAKEKGIAIYARATQGPLPGPDPSADGTVVRRNSPRMPGTVVGVASERDVVILEGDAAAADVLAVLDERGVPGKQLHIFDGRTTVAISRENLHDEERLRDALQRRFGDRIRLRDGLAAVSVVGAGINATYGNVRAGSETLRAAAVDPAGIATSSFRITWMIPRERTSDAVRALHQRFIESQQSLLP
jgi:aspartate kinase